MKKTSNNVLLRLTAICLIAIMLFSAVACGSESSDSNGEQTKAPEATESTEKDSDNASNNGSDVTVEELHTVKNDESNSDGSSDEATAAVSMIDVPVLASDIAQGAKIMASKVTTKKIRSDAVSITMVTDVDEVVGCYASVPLFAGDYFYKGKISESPNDNSASAEDVSKTKVKYLDVSQYVEPNTGEDLHTALQTLIDTNPKRTLYFPDGEYVISKPLQTSGDPTTSTSFYLSDNAVIKASNTWTSSSSALIKFGEGDTSTENNITVVGSNYFFIGGILDGNRKARGIELAGGRETLISKVKIVNAPIGIYIAPGINSGSSDMDIEDIDIIGYGASSIGMKIEGYDNNLVDVRISNVLVGVDSVNGNFFRGVSVRHDDNSGSTASYDASVAFKVSGNNWFYSCSSENMATGFLFTSNTEMIIKDFSIRWTQALGAQTAFKSEGAFSATCSNGIIDFFDETTNNSILVASSIGVGSFLDVIADTELCDETTYKSVFNTSKVGA